MIAGIGIRISLQVVEEKTFIRVAETTRTVVAAGVGIIIEAVEVVAVEEDMMMVIEEEADEKVGLEVETGTLVEEDRMIRGIYHLSL